MTRIEEKLYLQSVFDAIDEVYNLKNQRKSLTYEERLRASFSKLLIPDWYNHDYTTMNGLRKTKSHGQVPRLKRYDNQNYDTSNGSMSSSNNSPYLSNGTHRHRSPSRSWSERPPLRRNSTASSYDTNGSVIINGRRLTNSNGTSTYAPGVQRVAQSSTWYKPKIFTIKNTNSHSNEPPKPSPRYSKMSDQERIDLTDSFSSSSKLLIATPISNGNIRHPIKPRTMAQAPLPTEESSPLDLSSDGDITIIEKLSTSSSRTIDVPSLKLTNASSTTPHVTINNTNTNNSIDQSMTSNIPRTNSSKSVSSEAESYKSTISPALDKNLLATDSSSYTSVNEQCLSTSSSSYHTAVAGDTSSSSSVTGYETPIPQLDDETLSSHSSISDLSHAETLEPSTEDLDIVAVSTEEQKTAIIPSVDVGMENLPLPPFSSTLPSTSSSSTSDNSPSTDSRPIESINWYDDGSIATCIDQTAPQISSNDLRELSNDKILHEVDINGVNDEFFLISPRNTIDDELTSSISDDKQEQIESPTQTSKRLFTMEKQSINDDFSSLTDEFHCSSTVDPFGSTSNNNNNSSIMITNLDDILIDDDDDDDQHLKDPSTYLLNANYRRPIQEDILYEVEHENSYSDHSQNTSSILIADDNTSIKIDPNLDFLTSTEEPISNDIRQSTINEKLLTEKKSHSKEIPASPKESLNATHTLPIYILPPLYKPTEDPSTLRIDTNTNPSSYKWDSSLHYYSDLSTSSSPSSYTSKIRHRHYSVGSYYDNKTTTVALHPNHTLYIIGSAPVSPISRTSTTSSESHYHMHHHSPVPYGNVTVNALRRVNPFLETNTFVSNYDYTRSSSLNRDDLYRTISPPSIPAQPLTQTNPVTFPQYQIPTIPPKTVLTSPRPPLQREPPLAPSKTTPTSPPASSPPPPPLEREAPLVRPKTSRGRPRAPASPPPPPPPPLPPPLPPRTTSTEKEPTQNIYQEIDTVSTDDDQASTTRSADLQFIRGTIERVFDFHDESGSEASTNYDQISEDNKNDNESISLSNSSKTVSKKSNQYPAVEAVQRFYETKSPSESEKKIPHEQTTNLDDIPDSHYSSTSNKLYARSHPANQRKKDLSQSQSSDNEQASSEEVDDTLNDIEEDDYQDEKSKRQTANHSSHTSNENSPLHSSDNQINAKKTSQETQTLQRQKPIILTTQSPSGSQSTVQSYETAHSSIPPLDIVTQMIIERNDSIDDGRITEITGDMVIFYDDIEIVEHSSELSSSESESRSSISKSLPNSKPVQTIIESLPPPPPIPARTLKPVHLRNNQQQSPATQRVQGTPPPLPSSSSKVNRIYELEKSTLRKKFDVNSVNDMLNRAEYNIGAAVSHRHPSARHFVGKLNSEDTSSHNSNVISSSVLLKPSKTTMVKSQTLPLQSTATNGHSTNHIQQSPTKNPFSTLPTRSVSTTGTNGKSRSPIADTNALVKQIQNSLSRNSLHDSQMNAPLSVSTKDLRTFVSSTYSPSDENIMDDNGIIHNRQGKSPNHDEQAFARQARLSKSFHNVSEYKSIDEYPKKENNFTPRTQPSKSVENNLNRASQIPIRNSQIPMNFPPIISSTSFSALPHSEDNARMLSMKWYTGQVSENSEICYNTPHIDNDDLLYAYISAHSNQETQLLLARLQASNDIRIHAALDDVRFRVSQFDASKTPDELPVFMRYLESRLRDINNKNPLSSAATSTASNRPRRKSSSGINNGYPYQQQSDTISIKSRTSSIATGLGKDTPPSLRQLGRQHLRSTGNISGGGGTNGHQPPPLPRRGSQSSANQENPAVFDDMLNTVLGLPKKGVPTLPQTYPTSSSQSREKLATPFTQTQMTTTPNKTGRDVGKRLFESGTYKDPRLIYDGPRKNEKEERPLETSV